MKFKIGEWVIHKDHPQHSWTVQKYTSQTDVFCMRVDVINRELKIVEAIFSEADLDVSEKNTSQTV